MRRRIRRRGRDAECAAFGVHRVGAGAVPPLREAGREPLRRISPLQPGVGAEYREDVGEDVARALAFGAARVPGDRPTGLAERPGADGGPFGVGMLR